LDTAPLLSSIAFEAGTGRGEEGTYECGAWYIDDMPFAERTSLLERESACQRKMG
jgi:hypothetical protein